MSAPDTPAEPPLPTTSAELAQRIAEAIAQAVAEATAPLREALEDAKRTIATLLRQIHGVRSERTEVVLDAEGQLRLQLGITQPVPVPPPAAAGEDDGQAARRGTPRSRAGIAQRHPHLRIDETQAPLDPTLQEQVDAGVLRVERTGRFTDALVVQRAPAFIRREHEIRLVKAADGIPALTAPMQPRLVEGGVLADETIHHLMIAKFLDAIPFHRTLTGWQRQRIDLSKQTVNDAVTAWCTIFAPLADAIIAEILRAEVVFADDGWARTQAKGACAAANIWTLVGNGLVGYRFSAGRTHAVAPTIIPATFTGYLMCDGWAGWKTVADAQRGGCNAHARRPFARLAGENQDAALMVGLYAELYAVEHEANAGPPDGLLDRRDRLRRERSAPILDRIEQEAARIATAYPFSHPLAEGARYIANQRERLRRYLTQPLLPPDNNAAEGALRINALIRKNSLFFGSELAGERAAVALTVLHSCRIAGIEPHDWLAQVTPTLIRHAHGRQADLHALIPRA